MRLAAYNGSQMFYNSMLRKSNLWNLLKRYITTSMSGWSTKEREREKINNQAECNKRVKIERTQEWNKKEKGKQKKKKEIGKGEKLLGSSGSQNLWILKESRVPPRFKKGQAVAGGKGALFYS